MPGAEVPDLAQDRLRRRVQQFGLLGREERRGRLLDELLVTALQRAVAGRDDDDGAGGVGEALRLDVPRLVEVLLDEALAAAERGDGLPYGRVEQLGNLFAGAGDLEAASAAAEGRLDRDRQADLVDERENLVGIRNRVERSRRQGGADLLGDVSRGDLVAEPLDRVGRRADPDEPGVDHGPRELGVLGEEPVSRVHGVRARAAGDREQLLDHEVGVGRRGAVERVRLVGQLHVAGIPILVGVDGDRPDARIPRGPDHPHGDLPAIRDENLGDLLRGGCGGSGGHNF